MAYNVNHVLNTLLQRSFRESRLDMSPMKIQKMLFFTHGWHLATTGSPAVDQPFEVWQYGPVLSTIYHELKRFGSDPVTEYIKGYLEDKAYVVNSAETNLYRSVDIAWEKYIGIPAVNLSAMTHEPGSPWDIAMKRSLGQIPNDIIRDYFVRTATRH
jgi:uncharacterized phage-associated protein